MIVQHYDEGADEAQTKRLARSNRTEVEVAIGLEAEAEHVFNLDAVDALTANGVCENDWWCAVWLAV